MRMRSHGTNVPAHRRQPRCGSRTRSCSDIAPAPRACTITFSLRELTPLLRRSPETASPPALTILAQYSPNKIVMGRSRRSGNPGRPQIRIDENHHCWAEQAIECLYRAIRSARYESELARARSVEAKEGHERVPRPAEAKVFL